MYKCELAIEMARNICPHDLKQQLSARNRAAVPKTCYLNVVVHQYESLEEETEKNSCAKAEVSVAC